MKEWEPRRQLFYPDRPRLCELLRLTRNRCASCCSYSNTISVRGELAQKQQITPCFLAQRLASVCRLGRDSRRSSEVS